jgi:poly(A) polymerase
MHSLKRYRANGMIQAARRIIEKLRLNGYAAFFAGGWVRDYLLHRKPKDIDIATSALPNEVLRLFPNSKAIGVQFGVIQVRLYGRAYDVATFRSDFEYLDGRHPSSIAFSGPEQDALRRDFTINGLFYDPVVNRLIDYVCGERDIQNKVIQTIGNPKTRFSEDKLRMLRAIRFACDLGFTIVPETWDAIQELAPDILQISWERIRGELIKVLIGPAPDEGLNLLHQSGLLQHILPEVAALRGIPQTPGDLSDGDVFAHTQNALAKLHKPSAILAMGTLLHEAGKQSMHSENSNQGFMEQAQTSGAISEEIGRRLRMSNEEIARIVDLVSMHPNFLHIHEMGESDQRRLLCNPNIADHLELLRVHCLGNQRSLDIHSGYLEKLKELKQSVDPLLKGDDLIEMGYRPGPIFREILRTIEDLQFEGVLKTREEAVHHIKVSYSIKNRPH